VDNFKTPTDFFKDDKLNPIIDKKTGQREYTQGFEIATTAKEDRAAEAGAIKELNKEYNVLGSNCAATVQNALKGTGKNDGSPTVLEQAYGTEGYTSTLINEKFLILFTEELNNKMMVQLLILKK